MLRPLPFRLEALIIANFVAATVVSLEAMLGVAAYGVFAPNAASNGLSLLIGSAISLGLLAAATGFIIALPAYLAGLIVVGIPTWWALHRTRREGPLIFIAVAALESVAGGAFVALLVAPEALPLTPLLALPGGVAGWTIRLSGYERITPRPPRARP